MDNGYWKRIRNERLFAIPSSAAAGGDRDDVAVGLHLPGGGPQRPPGGLQRLRAAHGLGADQTTGGRGRPSGGAGRAAEHTALQVRTQYCNSFVNFDKLVLMIVVHIFGAHTVFS